MPLIATFIYYAIQLYIMLIFVYVLGSWFPQWKSQSWYRFIHDIVDPYVAIFRKLPLRMGMIDLSPMLAMMALWLFQMLIATVASGRGF